MHRPTTSLKILYHFLTWCFYFIADSVGITVLQALCVAAVVAVAQAGYLGGYGGYAAPAIAHGYAAPAFAAPAYAAPAVIKAPVAAPAVDYYVSMINISLIIDATLSSFKK